MSFSRCVCDVFIVMQLIGACKSFVNHAKCFTLRAMEQEKRPRGRPPVPPDEKLEQRSIRLTAAQWAKIEAAGGMEWLRRLIDRAKLK